MRHDEITTDPATQRADQQRHGALPDDAPPHLVDERDVRLALERLGLGDRALTVHRATAFLTALGVTVTHQEAAASAARAADERTPSSAAGVETDDSTADDGPGAGDVANLLEVRSHLRDRLPLLSAAELRARPRVAFAHHAAVATA